MKRPKKKLTRKTKSRKTKSRKLSRKTKSRKTKSSKTKSRKTKSSKTKSRKLSRKLSRKVSRMTKSRKTKPRKTNSKMYLIHDNGWRPFLVSILNGRVGVYITREKLPDKVHHLTFERKNINKVAHYYNNEILSFKAKSIFIGKSPKNYMTKSEGYGPNFLGNSILLNIKDKEYVYIGETIYKFQAYDDIVSYVSPIGGNDVPYPYAIDKSGNYYLMIQDVVVDLPKKLVKKYEEPYNIYYSWKSKEYKGYHKIEEKLDLKEMKFKNKKILQKRL